MPWKRTTAPTLEPVSVDQVKANCRITQTAEDGYLAELVAAARARLERETERAFLTQTWEQRLDGFPRLIEVERPPLQSVTSLQYVDPDGVLQTLASALYVVDTFSEPGRVYPAPGEAWPAIRDEPLAVRLVYVAGWTSALLVPEDLRLAVTRLASLWFEERVDIVTGTIVSRLPHDVERLIGPWRLRRPK